VHEADEPNAVTDFLDAELPSGKTTEMLISLPCRQTSSISDENIAVVEWITQTEQSAIGAAANRSRVRRGIFILRIQRENCACEAQVPLTICFYIFTKSLGLT
jgi:hypothetical protein